MKNWISITALCLVFLSGNVFAKQNSIFSQGNGFLINKFVPASHHHFKKAHIDSKVKRRYRRKFHLKLPDRYIVVPNRSDSTLTILETPSGDILKKITADDTGFEFEPMYASSLPALKMVVVSDRLNNNLLFFDNRTFRFLGAAPASQGLFHMWAMPEQKGVFVVADIDRVVDVFKFKRIRNHVFYKHQFIDVGAESETGKPHDIVVDKTHVYVTMLGVDGENVDKEDLVLKYNRQYLELENTLKFSFDVHLGLPEQSPYLLVPETTAGILNFVDKKTFEVVAEVEGVPGAHGIWWNSDASKVYIANFGSQGPESIYEIRQSTDTEMFAAEKVSTQALDDTKAHNITVDFINQVMFVTHSGPDANGALNRNVSLFSVKGTPTFIKTIESGANPLGILLVDR